MSFIATYGSLLGMTGAIITFLFGVFKYVQLQKSKEVSSLLKISESIEKFVSKQNTKLVFTLTDYTSFHFDTFPYGDITLNDITVSDEMLGYALRPHSKGANFTLFEAHLREIFDAYFTELEKYYYFIKIGAFDVDFLRPFIGYYVDIQGTMNPSKIRKNKIYLQCIHNYMASYFPVNLVKLYQKFGHEIQYRDLPYQKRENYDRWMDNIDSKIKEAKKQKQLS